MVVDTLRRLNLGLTHALGDIEVGRRFTLQYQRRGIDRRVICKNRHCAALDALPPLLQLHDQGGDEGGEGAKGESGSAAGEEAYAVNIDYDSRYRIPGGGEITVPGIIVELQPVVMRTDGVYVEALVGRNSAWDRYTEQLMAKELRD